MQILTGSWQLLSEQDPAAEEGTTRTEWAFAKAFATKSGFPCAVNVERDQLCYSVSMVVYRIWITMSAEILMEVSRGIYVYYVYYSMYILWYYVYSMILCIYSMCLVCCVLANLQINSLGLAPRNCTQWHHPWTVAERLPLSRAIATKLDQDPLPALWDCKGVKMMQLNYTVVHTGRALKPPTNQTQRQIEIHGTNGTCLNFLKRKRGLERKPSPHQ